ncbi:MAG TPA: pitrilysin family protein [Coleofasciculaceae cyanobacterium]
MARLPRSSSWFRSWLPPFLRQSHPPRSCIALVLVWLVAVVSWVGFTQPVLARTPSAQGAATPTQSIQPYLDRAIERVTEFSLENGMKFLVMERHQAPVVSFVTYTDVGGADEPDGKTGVAHFLEHLAFKGTTQIGTINYQQEKPLLDQLDQLNQQIEAATAKNDKATVAKLSAEFTETQATAEKLVQQNQFGRIVEQSGGVGLNATTSTDATRYFYSFPSNKLELWMSLESERFLDPVLRQFYKEKDVILEERRLRTDNSPIGQLVEAFLDKAYTVHPYKRPVIGYDRDIRGLTRQDVQQFFDTYYVPSHLTIAVVGDVDPAQVKRLAQIYFGRFKPATTTPPQVAAIEPPQTQDREVTLKLKSEPWYLEGYHRPALSHPDNVVYEMISSILSDGRTSRLYKTLVEARQIALVAQGFNGFPGDKFPNMILFYAMTAPGQKVDQVGAALRAEIERLKTEPVSAEELDRVKTQARAGLLRSLNSNMGMAQALLDYEVKTGDWRNLFAQIDQISKVTSADVQRVAQATFTPQNRTVGRILPQDK